MTGFFCNFSSVRAIFIFIFIPLFITLFTVPASVAAGPADSGAVNNIKDHNTASTCHDVQAELGMKLPFISVIPFIILLLAIAVVPLVMCHFWECNRNKAIISAICALPVFIYLLTFGPTGQEVLLETLHEYYAFIILLVALFTISGGIYLEGNLRATPAVNTIFLGLGALLASFIGTTGATMLLIRPLIKANSEREHKVHTFIFFIFLVSNIGGSLLPVGDPPLFIGYLYGVPFFWTLKMWPLWLMEVVILLTLYFFWDKRAYAREKKENIELDEHAATPMRVEGKLNILLMLGVLASVVFLKKYEVDGVTLDMSWMQQPVMLLLALISFNYDYQKKHAAHSCGVINYRSPREKNFFNFHAMVEVAVLFAGIFITMIPALCLLKARGAELGVTKPWQFFWMTGILSSFLDNAPTYATFFALGQGVTKGLLATPRGQNLELICTPTGSIWEQILLAISAGAVFMGANTYIGNAPNFMVKSICEQAKISMPSFFGYMLWSLGILLPTFILITFIFF